VDLAWATKSIVEEWLAQPNFSLLAPGDRHWRILASLLPEAQARGPLVMDADLAALAIEHGATLYSNDRDFSRFPGLKYVNPLRQAGLKDLGGR
jgi:predicted nucleic acid-binding protein